jgi:hypothetical protein
MFVTHQQASEITHFLTTQRIKRGGSVSYVINEYDHPEYGRVIAIFSPFMNHFVVAHDGYLIPEEEM